jgi:hypothetical protein
MNPQAGHGRARVDGEQWDRAVAMSTPAEQLNRVLREIGEALADSLREGASAFGDILVELERTTESAAPVMTVTGVRGESRTRVPPPSRAVALITRVAGLGGKYKHWLHVTVHFHGNQLPIPVGVTVRPIVEEHHP